MPKTVKKNQKLKAPPEVPAFILDRAGFLLSRLGQRIRDMVEEALRPYALTGKHLGILWIIREKGSLPQQEIGKCMHVDRSTMVQITDDLEKAGLVERKESPQDRRAYALFLTAKGREVLPQAQHLSLGAEKKFLSGLSPRDQKTLLRLLKQLLIHSFADLKS